MPLYKSVWNVRSEKTLPSGLSHHTDRFVAACLFECPQDYFPVRCNGAEAGALQRAFTCFFRACRATCMTSCCVVPHIFSTGWASLRAPPSHFSCIFGNSRGHRIMFYLELLRGHLCDFFPNAGGTNEMKRAVNIFEKLHLYTANHAVVAVVCQTYLILSLTFSNVYMVISLNFSEEGEGSILLNGASHIQIYHCQSILSYIKKCTRLLSTQTNPFFNVTFIFSQSLCALSASFIAPYKKRW